MRFGVSYVCTDEGMGPAEVARMLEEHGQESMFVNEHSHIPASRDTPYPTGDDLPRMYSHVHDPFVALTAAATATRRLRIGTGVCLVTQRDPILTAKAVASLDCLSGGRFEFGVGAGWNREEMGNHGTDPRTRMRLFTERVLAMREIWTHDVATFHGGQVNFDEIWSWPKPLQRPGPPVLVGGSGPTVLDRVVAVGDAWFPNWSHVADGFEVRIGELRARTERRIEVMAINVPADPHALERCEQAGVTRAVHLLRPGGRNSLEAELGRWEAAIDELLNT